MYWRQRRTTCRTMVRTLAVVASLLRSHGMASLYWAVLSRVFEVDSLVELAGPACWSNLPSPSKRGPFWHLGNDVEEQVMHEGRLAAASEASRYVATRIEEYVDLGDEPPFVLGLGSGRTAELFVAALGELRKEYQNLLVCIPTSERTWQAVERAGLGVSDEGESHLIDLAVDGADEIGPGLTLVKGGGGALFRERIVAEYAGEFVVIADEGKLVSRHGAFPLPIEVSPFCLTSTVAEVVLSVRELGYDLDPVKAISLRSIGGVGRRLFTTENGNHIIDVTFGRIANLEDLDVTLSVIAGVVGHGLFLDVANFALIGSADGGVRRIGAPSLVDNNDNGAAS